MPLTTAGPAASIEPPRAGLPLTVGNSCTVSTSQMTAPVLVAYARRWPSTDPEKTTPGIAVTAADSAAADGYRFNGDFSSPLGYDMLQGLSIGDNYVWNINYQQRLANNLQITISYDGRKSENQPVINIGRMEARYLF